MPYEPYRRNQKHAPRYLYTADLIYFEDFDWPRAIRGFRIGTDKEAIEGDIERWYELKKAGVEKVTASAGFAYLTRAKVIAEGESLPDLTDVEDIGAFLSPREERKPEDTPKEVPAALRVFEEQMKGFDPRS